MTNRTYYAPHGGLPGQSGLLTSKAVFTDAYAVIPQGVMQDFVTSIMPFWQDSRMWVLARPLSGFAETFSQSIVEINPGGGSDKPESDETAEAVLFILEGEVSVTLAGQEHTMIAGGYAFIPPDSEWQIKNKGSKLARFHWIRKSYEFVDGVEPPEAFFTNENEIEPEAMPDTDGVWATTRFVDLEDVRHDMHVNIVSLKPGGKIPFSETHVMEHGIYVLQGSGVYRLNQDWVEVEAGDFVWLRAFCPQACYAGGPENFRYLLYKNVNRQMKLNFAG